MRLRLVQSGDSLLIPLLNYYLVRADLEIFAALLEVSFWLRLRFFCLLKGIALRTAVILLVTLAWIKNNILVLLRRLFTVYFLWQNSCVNITTQFELVFVL